MKLPWRRMGGWEVAAALLEQTSRGLVVQEHHQPRPLLLVLLLLLLLALALLVLLLALLALQRAASTSAMSRTPIRTPMTRMVGWVVDSERCDGGL